MSKPVKLIPDDEPAKIKKGATNIRVGIASDHGGFELKAFLVMSLKKAGYEVIDFGAHEMLVGDDYPDPSCPWSRQ